MQVQDVMTSDVQFIPPTTTLDVAAQMMRDLDCGFLPISDSERRKLQGVITDRDITIRCVAEGLDPNETRVTDAMTHKVLYCFAEDELQEAADSMHEQQVYRLIVLDNRDDKKLCGIISLGDIVAHGEEQLAARASKGIHRDQMSAS